MVGRLVREPHRAAKRVAAVLVAPDRAGVFPEDIDVDRLRTALARDVFARSLQETSVAAPMDAGEIANA